MIHLSGKYTVSISTIVYLLERALNVAEACVGADWPDEVTNNLPILRENILKCRNMAACLKEEGNKRTWTKKEPQHYKYRRFW